MISFFNVQLHIQRTMCTYNYMYNLIRTLIMSFQVVPTRLINAMAMNIQEQKKHITKLADLHNEYVNLYNEIMAFRDRSKKKDSQRTQPLTRQKQRQEQGQGQGPQTGQEPQTVPSIPQPQTVPPIPQTVAPMTTTTTTTTVTPTIRTLTTMTTIMTTETYTRLPDKTYECKTCRTIMKTKEGMESHLKRHTGEVFRCPHNPSHVFTHRGALRDHLRDFCRVGGARFVCDICDKQCQKRQGLEAHRDTHCLTAAWKCVIPNCPIPKSASKIII